MSILLGIDTGGTYTDAVLFDEDKGVIETAKALTTRHDLSVGIAGAVSGALVASGIPASEVGLVSLSTTLATNALVEGQGGRVCLILIGFDETALGRAGLAEALQDDPYIIVSGGHNADGSQGAPFDADYLASSLEALRGQISAVAVAGQFAVRNPAHEVQARDLIWEQTGLPVTCSHELSSKLDGPRRALTCVLNTRLISLIHHLIASAEKHFSDVGIDAPVMVVRGDGALISAEVAKLKPIETILSGPAASVVGASWLTGQKNAIVSDIGGTTTDSAVLQDGQPRLDTQGATVGGWRTMVEAVDMRTIGLGGDSEVRVVPQGTKLRMELGPRRVIPLCLFAKDNRELVYQTLERQAKRGRHEDYDGIFVTAIGRTSAHLAALPEKEQALLDEITPAPLALDKALKTRMQLGTLNRLVSRGLVMLSAVTPTDASHVLGTYQTWDVEAAERGLAVYASRKDGLGQSYMTGAKELARFIIDTLELTSAQALLTQAMHDDGYDDAGPALFVLRQRAEGRAAGLVEMQMKLSIPVIGLGASAPIYYPGVTELLGTEAVIPEHAGVANAVGAVVGQVRITRDALVTQPEQGRYRIFLGAADSTPKDYTNLDAALREVHTRLEDEVRRSAETAGAGDISVKFARADKTADIEGKQTLIEAHISATASGRPRIAT
ncbi:MAG: hydantoinase/oxoprolinase family protein [Rhizobiales bacterium]|nr:hydantoinase/oxoprolinase family protein [Hyphomicrobiales bacterium]